MGHKLLIDLCSVPTAPFVEHRVVAFIEQFVAKRPKLRLTRDGFGNLLVELKGTGGSKLPRWVYTAHMDHPGFVARRMLEPGLLEARFHGWVREEFFKGERIRFFDGDAETVATVLDFRIGKERKVPDLVRLRVKRAVTPGSPGMWDQGTGRIAGGKFKSRVCDDLAGAAAAMEMLDRLHARPPAATVAVLFTRAEEDGFIGAIAASLKPKLLRRSDNIIAIETSAMQPYAPQGKGAIVRTGDRTSIFNSDLTYFISEQAESLKKKDKRFQYQRALMPGGTCEATVYDAYGFKAASICVALGNYHNMDQQKKRIAPEYIDLGDWESMVKLFVRVAKEGHTHEPGMKKLKQRVEKTFNARRALLSDPLAKL
jgi:putative aminopeptidase FrvX